MKKPAKKKAAAKKVPPQIVGKARKAPAAKKSKITKPKEKLVNAPNADKILGRFPADPPSAPLEKLTVIACTLNAEHSAYDVVLSDGAVVTVTKPQDPGEEFQPEAPSDGELKAQIAEQQKTIESLRQQVIDLTRIATQANELLGTLVKDSVMVGVAPPSSTEALGKTGDLPVHKSMEDLEAEALATVTGKTRKSRKT